VGCQIRNGTDISVFILTEASEYCCRIEMVMRCSFFIFIDIATFLIITGAYIMKYSILLIFCMSVISLTLYD